MDELESLMATRRLAEAVRNACVEAARRGYEEAAMSGLCHEGAAEASIDAIRMLDIDAVIAKAADDQLLTRDT